MLRFTALRARVAIRRFKVDVRLASLTVRLDTGSAKATSSALSLAEHGTATIAGLMTWSLRKVPALIHRATTWRLFPQKIKEAIRTIARATASTPELITV